MEEVKYSEIQRELRNYARWQSHIVGAGGGLLFCESPGLGAASWGSGVGDSASILKELFGFLTFRPLQKEIVSCVLSGRDTLAVMPAGGGKSLCYQLGAVLLGGLTIVITPLTALVHEQVGKIRPRLRQFDMEAVCLSSSLSSEAYRAACQNLELACNRGQGGILYISPEFLSNWRLGWLLESLSENVKLLAVDEAHCISEWGNDFRPEYLRIGAFRRLFPHACCLALTASATKTVRQDIIRQLNMYRPELFIGAFDSSDDN
ncbi:MAG: DEAD/DEAH box helicase [Treponema sp.]|nr:DEAD/DEAH box helicase [Treponema sp.]